jgi:two-component system nitrogen regulation sensor histidine kinase NtrY
MTSPLTLSFRRRLLLILILLGAVPTGLAVLGWALTMRASNPIAATRATIEDLGVSGRVLVETIDSTKLSRPERRALSEHATHLNDALSLVRRAEVYARYYYAGLTLVILLLGGVVIYASLRLGGHLSRQLSRPIDELVGWTRHIQRREPLPDDQPRRGAPEFEELRIAFREMDRGLQEARDREIESERLRAFREVARRVAHEMKNPLTPIRFAVSQLERGVNEGGREALEVIRAESARLEQLAREFTEFGRLPEGPAAEVDLQELLDGLLRTSLPAECPRQLDVAADTPRVLGHYDPLRRAFGNLVRNAFEAAGTARPIEVWAGVRAPGAVLVRIIDHGPGVPDGMRDRVFDPYVTSKSEGTGLGLALVRQTIENHGGKVRVTDTPGGGATFEVTLPVPA